ncbi:type II secretion system major pseudopilin GspG [Maricaulis sp.]|uniref:type II secretion system major pseudopilin GspG n=1 Tax=Maricaulis sp. TaxID=1486257 RepID=UPI0025C5DD24|nr:type II secretion system major pseudopilin GspG [Maricaulis sp.]
MMPSSDRKSPHSAHTDREAGITLMELLVVMVIIALLATLVAPRVIGYLGRSKADVARAQLSSIATSLELYYLDMGRYPDPEGDGLLALVDPPEDANGWQGPYFNNREGLIDPWGTAYAYTLADGTDRYVISSLGADGVVGGEGEDQDLTRS